MVLQRKRHLLLGLGLTVTLLMVGLSPAVASAASTLTGERFGGDTFGDNSGACAVVYDDYGGALLSGLSGPTFSGVSGTASAPYPGTFTEGGAWIPAPSFKGGYLDATFTIASGTTTISGRMVGGAGMEMTCSHDEDLAGPASAEGTVPYTATIHTPSGNFHDEGTSSLVLTLSPLEAFLKEAFTSSLTHPVLIVPTTKAQCKDGGWRNFPQFKNQGQCIAFVEDRSGDGQDGGQGENGQQGQQG